MLQIFNRVVHKDFDKEDPVNKKITLAVAAAAVAGLLALVGAPLLSQSGAASQPSIQGVWQITETTTTGKDAATNKSPQPSLYIFTAKHYSIARVNGTKPRTDLRAQDTEDYTKATAAQLLAAWGPSAFTASSGTYELAGGKLTTRALVSRGTAPMAPGAFSTASYKLDGKTLTITQERGVTGPVENPTTWKLTRIE
jgi:hypothetical protein